MILLYWKQTKAEQLLLYIDVKYYVARANDKQLKDNSFYQKLNVDPTAQNSEIVSSVIESFRKQELLSHSTASKLSVDEVRTPHIFPKVHEPNALVVRPVVSSVECHTSKISKFLDHYLQPHAKSSPSCIKFNKLLSNSCFNTNTGQFHIQWNSPSAKNGMRYGNNMYTILCEHFQGKIWKKKKYFHIFTADLSIIYSFFGMEPEYNFKNSLTSLTIAIL